ncbi:YbhN family protein [uncultured Williamsia sp.]|uniref:lysylphosphatidylglycerol synthase transmembrane domain-containing protein n=1 Tax=uncultured Williamsia sp. TaxID=259311 RepID=UPI002625E247|nr:YbhN family protein [uncultured Williamsia sp.]
MTAQFGDAAEDGVPAAPTRRRFWWVRWVALALVVVVLTVEVVLVWPKLTEAWRSMGSLHWWWVVACIVASGFSMDSFAQVQRALLRSAGVRVSQMKSLAVVLAANSVSQTMPGGNVLAPAFTYRQTRKWGASPVVASWQVVMSGLLMGVGLAVLGIGGALLAGAKTSPFSVIFSIGGFLAFVILAQYIASHPEMMKSIGTRTLYAVNNMRDKDHEHGVARWHEIVDQLRAVQLTGKDTSIAFGWSLFNWLADVACLAFACYAVGGEPGIAGLAVAYAAGKAVGTAFPLLPGGLGVVDAVLVPALTSAGMGAGEAVTAVLVYRLISYLLVALVGWIVIAVMFRQALSDTDAELDAEVHADATGAPDAPPAPVTDDPDPPDDRPGRT